MTNPSDRWVSGDTPGADLVCIRHVLATLAYRGGKVLRDMPESAAHHEIGSTSRTPVEILSHINEVLAWAYGAATGKEPSARTKPVAWPDEVSRFHALLEVLDADMRAAGKLACAPERLLQGPLADALTHVGQIAMIRRLAGCPVRGEDYFSADIRVGRVGPDQARSQREFD